MIPVSIEAGELEIVEMPFASANRTAIRVVRSRVVVGFVEVDGLGKSFPAKIHDSFRRQRVFVRSFPVLIVGVIRAAPVNQARKNLANISGSVKRVESIPGVVISFSVVIGSDR